MTHKYIYIRDFENFSVNSVVYTIMIGESKSEIENLKVINSFASIYGGFFEKYSESVRKRLMQLDAHTFGVPLDFVSRYRTAVVPSKTFRAMLLRNTLDNYEKRLCEPKAKSLLRMMISTDFYMKFSGAKLLTPAPDRKRKNLSDASEVDLYSALVGFGLVLAFGLVGAILEAIEKVVMMY